MIRIVDRVIDYLTPLTCVSCERQGELLCHQCLPGIIIDRPETCPMCNVLSSLGRTCSACKPATVLAGATVASYYDGAVKDLIMRTKFSSYRAGAKLAAELMQTSLSASGLESRHFDLVTAIPTTATRRRQRGYNQAELMARALSARFGLPYASLLGRVGKARQMGASRAVRLEQLSGAMYARGHVAGKRILVVDDVTTTGVTFSEAANVLKAAGAAGVWAVALAKH